MTASLRSSLLKWHDLNGRHDLPWNNTTDPYLIWLSEIILQQTQVVQGLPYYKRFVDQYPDLESLALAPIDEVLKHWEGLGYYSRARNLHKGAKYILSECNGVFPDTREELLKIPGVGPYTSAAISSFAYNLKHPVVDGNVIRILSRVHGITESVQEKAVLQKIEELAQDLILEAPPAQLNRAMMDLGATVCKTKNPRCEECPWQNYCAAYEGDLLAIIPYKHKKIAKQKRTLHLLIQLDEWGKLVSSKRKEKDIWQGLYSLPETNQPPGKSVIELDHQLTHRHLKLYFYTQHRLDVLRAPIEEALKRHAFPVAIRKGLERLL